MGGLLGALQRLQEIELKISHLRRQEQRKTRQIRAAERQAHQADEQVAELQAESTRRQRELDQLDRDVTGRDASILKHREELLRARTNKDYAAILTAINTEKADSAKVERLALEKLGELERLQEQVSAQTQRQESAQKRLAEAKQALEEFLASTADVRGTYQRQREEAAEALPAGTLATFTRVAERHDGEALAAIVRLQPKREEYGCDGCNMKVPLDAVNTVRTGDEIRLCPNCGRILHLAEQATAGS